MHFEITPEFLASQGLSLDFADRFWAKVDKNGPVPKHMPHLGKCWVWLGSKDGNGYGQIGGRGKLSTIRTHVASCILHFGGVPKGKCACHKCDNPECVRPSHLWIGTQGDNVRDMIAKGRYNKGESRRGEENPSSKLTEHQVRQIRTLSSEGMLRKHVAKIFGVTPENVSYIVLRKGWKHVH